MNKEELKELLNKVQTGEKSVDEAVMELRMGPIQDIDIAQLDMHRGLRQGIGEVIYGAGKTPEQIDRIAHAMWEAGQKMILVTRMSQKAAPDDRKGRAGLCAGHYSRHFGYTRS